MAPVITTYNNAIGVYLCLADLADTTARVVVTVTDVLTSGSGSAGTTNLTHYMAIGQTTTEFQLPITNALSAEYTLSIEGRNSVNVAIADNSHHTTFTYVPPPAAFVLPTIGTGSETVMFTFGALDEKITHMQLYLTEMGGAKRPCSVTILRELCTEKTVTVNGTIAKVGGEAIDATFAHPLFVFSNGTGPNADDVDPGELEVTVVAMNASGSSPAHTTTSVIPSANANTPTGVALATGINLVAIDSAVSDEKIAVTITPGTEVTGLPDTHYVMHVGSLYKELYKEIAVASFSEVVGSGDLQIIFANGSADWTTATTGIVGDGDAQTLTLIDGESYAVQVKAKNANLVSPDTGYSLETDGVSGTPSGLPEVPTFGLKTGIPVGSGEVQLTIRDGDGDLTTTAVDNGSDMTSYLVTITGPPGVAGVGEQTVLFADITDNKILLTGLTNGTGYTFLLTAINANGSTESAGTDATTPSTIPDALSFIADTTGPDLNEMASVVATASGEVKLSWNFLTGTTGNGGLSSGAVAGITYEYQVANNADFTGALLADLSGTDLVTDTVDGLVNGTYYYAQIRATNSNGSGPWTVYGGATPLPLVPSVMPDFTGSAINTALLDSFMTNQYITGGAFTLDMGAIDDGANLTALNNITYNGGYNINKIAFEVSNGTNTVTSGLLDITTGTVTFDGGVDNPAALNPGLSRNYTYTCKMYLMNAAYNSIANSTAAVESAVKLTDTISTTASATATTGDGTMTFSFNQAQPNGTNNTLITGFSAQLQESHAVQLNGANEITWSDYANTGDPNAVDYNDSNGTGTAYTTTFAGTNGVRYRALVTTNSEQPLKSSQANLAAVVSPGAVTSSEGNMPYGSPIITHTNGATNSQVSFSVKANGKPLEDAIMLHGGSAGDNYYAFTTELLASTRAIANNGGATYGANLVYAPFNTYQKLDANGDSNGSATDFVYTATDKACQEGRKFLTLVSGEAGHYSAASSNAGAMNFLNIA